MQIVTTFYAVFRTGTGGMAGEAYWRTFSSGPLCHWSPRMRIAFLPCPKGYVSQRAADQKSENQANRNGLSGPGKSRRTKKVATSQASTDPADGGAINDSQARGAVPSGCV